MGIFTPLCAYPIELKRIPAVVLQGTYKPLHLPLVSLFLIASDKSKSPIGIGGYTVNMRIPGETTRKINHKIPKLQDLQDRFTGTKLIWSKGMV